MNFDTLTQGIELGLAQTAPLDYYYGGLTPCHLTWEPLQKDITIDTRGRVAGGKLVEEPVEQYMKDLVAELSSGVKFSETRQKDHIERVLNKFSDRRFEAKDWWQKVTEPELMQLLDEVRAVYAPQTQLLETGVADAFMFGKFSRVLTDNLSLDAARRVIRSKKNQVSDYDKARIEFCDKFSRIFWDKAISRSTDKAKIKILEYNRDLTTGIIKNPDRKSLSSLTVDLYHGIKKDNSLVLRDLDRIILTETASSQNYGVLTSGYDRGDQWVIVHVQETACKKCKDMYLDESGKPKRFSLELLLKQPRDANWNKKKGAELVPQMPTLHPYCYCRAYTL